MSEWKLIKSRVAGKVPSVNQVDEDTLAFNQYDGILYALLVQDGVKQVIAIGGTNGNVPGADGREIELQKTATHIQWRYVGEDTWTNLVALSDITGPQGPQGDDGIPVELRTTATHIQWRYVGGTWTDLLSLDDFSGHIDHELIQNIGTYKHAGIDSHIGTQSIHRQTNYVSALKCIVWDDAAVLPTETN